MQDGNQAAALQAFFRLMTMNGGVRVFHIARSTGLLQALNNQPQSAETVAAACGLQSRPTLLLLRVLAALGLVREEATGFSATPLMALLTGPYAALSDTYWEHLPSYLTTAEPLCRMDDPAEAEMHYVRQASSLDWMMRGPAAVLAQRLAPRLPPTARLIDVGAGAGTWSLALLAALPQASGVALDRPGVLAVAKQNAARAGLDGRLGWLAGDFFSCPPPPPADLIILANVCHGLTAEQIARLFNRLRGWLAPQGQLVVVDVLEVQPAAALTAALYELGLALRTRNGQVHSRQCLEQWLAEAGFAEPECLPLPGEPGMMAALRTTVR
jgi:precorrin-6B methylase 2